MAPAVEITEVGSDKDLGEFIRFPRSLYRRDPFYAPPLDGEMRKEFSKRENPFFLHADARFYLARRAGEAVGRVAFIVNHLHNEFHGERTGFFGFFESVEDEAVSGALLRRAGEEAEAAGMERLRGPMSFSTNEECGFLVEGFREPPMLMTPYNPPYYPSLMEAAGMRKVKDLFAYLYAVEDELPEKILRVAALAERRGVRTRRVEKRTFLRDLRAFQSVYNSAWEENWGFVPLTDEEVSFMGARLKDVAVPGLTLIAERDGEAVGFVGLLPDFNRVLRVMGGRLNPWTVLRALLARREISDLRMLLLGIRRDMRMRGVDALLFREAFRTVKGRGYRRVEFSWILEDNVPVQRLVEMIGGRPYKRFRIYEKTLAGR